MNYDLGTMSLHHTSNHMNVLKYKLSFSSIFFEYTKSKIFYCKQALKKRQLFYIIRNDMNILIIKYSSLMNEVNGL